MTFSTTSFILRRVCNIFMKPANLCSLCSGTNPLEEISLRRVCNNEADNEREIMPSRTEDVTDTGKILDLFNTRSESELRTLKHINYKTAAGIISHREKHGLFHKMEDLLTIPGIGRKILEKVTNQILNPQTKRMTPRIEAQSNVRVDLTSERLESLQDVVSIDVGLKHISWLHMDKDRWVHQWHCHKIEGISPGRWDPIGYLRLVSSAIEEMPRPDLYVLEHKSFTALNKGTFQTMLFVRCLESMFYTSLNRDLQDSGEVKAISLQQNVVGKHFGLIVGTQRKSGQVVVQTLLTEGLERRNSWFPVRIAFDNASTFNEATKYKKEHLANSLLRAVAFYDIYVDNKPGFKM